MPGNLTREVCKSLGLWAGLLLVLCVHVPVRAAGPWCQPGWRHRAAGRASPPGVSAPQASPHAVAAERRFVLVQPTLAPLPAGSDRHARHRGPQFGYPLMGASAYPYPWGWFGARLHDDLSVGTGYYEQYTDWSWFFSN